MIKASYPDRETLEDVLLEAIKNPRQPISLRLDGGDNIEIVLERHEHDNAVGKMTLPPYSLVTVNLNTQEVTID